MGEAVGERAGRRRRRTRRRPGGPRPRPRRCRPAAQRSRIAPLDRRVVGAAGDLRVRGLAVVAHDRRAYRPPPTAPPAESGRRHVGGVVGVREDRAHAPRPLRRRHASPSRASPCRCGPPTCWWPRPTTPTHPQWECLAYALDAGARSPRAATRSTITSRSRAGRFERRRRAGPLGRRRPRPAGRRAPSAGVLDADRRPRAPLGSEPAEQQGRHRHRRPRATASGPAPEAHQRRARCARSRSGRERHAAARWRSGSGWAWPTTALASSGQCQAPRSRPPSGSPTRRAGGRRRGACA